MQILYQVQLVKQMLDTDQQKVAWFKNNCASYMLHYIDNR